MLHYLNTKQWLQVSGIFGIKLQNVLQSFFKRPVCDVAYIPIPQILYMMLPEADFNEYPSNIRHILTGNENLPNYKRKYKFKIKKKYINTAKS